MGCIEATFHPLDLTTLYITAENFGLQTTQPTCVEAPITLSGPATACSVSTETIRTAAEICGLQSTQSTCIEHHLDVQLHAQSLLKLST